MKSLIYSLLFISASVAANPPQSIQSLINKHMQTYSKTEHFTAIQVSIKQNDTLNTYVSGTRSSAKNSPALKADDLFNIGSITKSFTASLAVIADTDEKINLDSTVERYLPDYTQWDSLTLKGLLNMSTGIPNYSDSPTINYLFSHDIKKEWTPKALINLVYPQDNNPPRKPGYFYSNTGYVLMDMILSAQYKQPFSTLLDRYILKPLALKNTYYPVPYYTKEQLARLVRGYGYNIYDNPELVGRDVTDNSLSWAGAAGGIIANSEDVTHWVEALFINDKILTQAQKNTMQRLVSVKTGQPINQTDSENPRGFGLGIIQSYDDKIGHYWFYQGETLGYRALYMYVPATNIIITALFNSATNGENDHAGLLLQTLYYKLTGL